MDPKYIVTLELSGTQIKGAVASVNNTDGTPNLPTIEAVIAEDSEDSIQYGRVQNLFNASNITNDVVQRLQAQPALRDGVINGAYVAIGGRSLCSELTTAEISLPNERVITPDILESLYIEAAKNVSNNKRVLKVLHRKYYVDNQSIQTPVGVLGSKLRGDFTLVTCNPINTRNLGLVLSNKDGVNIQIKDYVVTQLALADMLLGEEEKQRGSVLVDLGHQTTTISIYKDRALQYLVTLPMGAQNITNDIAMGMNMTVEKAESAKRVNGDAAAVSSRANDELSLLNNFVAARAYEIAANINANIGYAKYKAEDLPSGFVITGGGANLKNFDSLLSSISKMPVKRAKMPSNAVLSPSMDIARQEGYMALAAIILSVSRNRNFDSCVTFPEVQKPVVAEEPKPETRPTVNTAKQYTQREETTVRTVDDSDWDKDDKDEEEEVIVEKKTKKSGSRRGILKKIQERVFNLVAADDMEDDENLG